MLETTRLLRTSWPSPASTRWAGPSKAPTCSSTASPTIWKPILQSLNVAYQRQPIEPLRENIVAVFDPPGATHTLVFKAHQDTVPTDNMTIEPFGEPQVENGRLYGRGACDIKGGMAAMVAAFARLVREKPAGAARVVMACTVDEEFTFLGVKRLVKDDLSGGRGHPVDAVVAEPTSLQIVNTHKGEVRWHLTTHGQSCHSSRPELGVNAIYHMAEVLPHVARYAEELRAASTRCSGRRR